MKEKEYKIGSITGSGKTIKEAKAAAEAAVTEAVTGSYDPIVIYWREAIAVIFRHPLHGWGYQILWDAAATNGTIRESSCTSEEADRETAKEKAAYGIVTAQWKPEDGIHPPHLIREEDHKEYQKWAQWQLYAHEGKDAGLSYHDAHTYACARQDGIILFGANDAVRELLKEKGIG